MTFHQKTMSAKLQTLAVRATRDGTYTNAKYSPVHPRISVHARVTGIIFVEHSHLPMTLSDTKPH
jgi:hypothetical protein